jgi:DNA adenine methylase
MAKPNQNIFPYMGNKATIAGWIHSHFPSHKLYVEVFGGSAAMMVNKPKSTREVYNDFNPLLSNFFHVVRFKGDEFIRELENTVISEHWYNKFYDYLNSDYDKSEEMEVENALRYFYIMTLCFGGKWTGGFIAEGHKEYYNMLWEKKIELLKFYINRFKNVVVMNKSFEWIIEKYGSMHDTVIYLDPPYVGTESYYKVLAGEFSVVHHLGLRDMLMDCNAHFFLSYEDDELVREMYKGFIIHEKNKHSHGRNKTDDGSANKLSEVLVTNYSQTTKLFSYESLREQTKRRTIESRSGLPSARVDKSGGKKDSKKAKKPKTTGQPPRPDSVVGLFD